MRTTVTPDSKTERLSRRAMAERGLSFKAALNSAIQRGLADLTEDEEVFRRFPDLRTEFPLEEILAN